MSNQNIIYLNNQPDQKTGKGGIKKISTNIQATASLMIVISIIVSVNYFLFLLNPLNVGNLYAYIPLVLSEFYIIFQTTGAWWTMLYAEENPRDDEYYETQEKLLKNHAALGKIAAFITVYGEAPELVEKTTIGVRDMEISHDTYILDDGNSPEIKVLAEKLDVNYISRSTNKGKKAGNINNALKKVNADIIAFFDSDYVPKKEFLIKTVPFFIDSNVAFVQTPQKYRNTDNFISKGSDDAQRIFYDIVCRGKNHFNSAFWVGTNAVFRKKALESVGGVTVHPSEDILTSYQIHQKGWRSIYIHEVLATGIGPSTLRAYFNQQLRWAGGSFAILIRDNPIFKRGLTADQRLQYLHVGTFYLGGFVVLTLILLPTLYILFGFKPIDTTLLTWFQHYIPYFVVQYFTAWFVLGRFSTSAVVLSMNSFPAYIFAFLGVIRDKEIKWEATNKRDVEKSSGLGYLYPHAILLLIILLSIPIALVHIREPAITAIALFWTLVNTLILSYFIFTHVFPVRLWNKRSDKYDK